MSSGLWLAADASTGEGWVSAQGQDAVHAHTLQQELLTQGTEEKSLEPP